MANGPVELQERVFYIETPRGLIKRLIISLLLVVYGLVVVILFRLYSARLFAADAHSIAGLILYIGYACVVIGLVLSASPLAKLLIAARKPMLVLTPANVTIWNVTIPWALVTGLTSVKLQSGATRPAIELAKGKSTFTAAPGNLAPISVGTEWFKKDLARYGAIPISRVRGASDDELQLLTSTVSVRIIPPHP